MVAGGYSFLFVVQSSASEVSRKGIAELLEAARRQQALVEPASGAIDGGRTAADVTEILADDASERRVDDAALLEFVPDLPPDGFGLGSASLELDSSLLSLDDGSSDVLEVVERESARVGRSWLGSDMAVTVVLREFPYEMFASSAGLGYRIAYFQRNYLIAEMWSGILLLGLVGVLLAATFGVVERWVLRWYHGIREVDRA